MAKSPSQAQIAERNARLLHTAMRRANIATIHELATLSGVTPSNLYRFEKGVVQMFSRNTQMKLAPVLPTLFLGRSLPILSDKEFEEAARPIREAFQKTVAEKPLPRTARKAKR